VTPERAWGRVDDLSISAGPGPREEGKRRRRRRH